MNIHEKIEKMKSIENSILTFIDKESDIEESQQDLIQLIIDSNILTNKYDLKTFLYLLSKILNNHYRYPNFFSKIEKIFKHFESSIKKNISNNEIFKIFLKCPRFILYLYSENVIDINEEIINLIKPMTFVYLFPESAIEYKMIEKLPENFEVKQKIGENDDLISEMIRNDKIDEFISYVKQNDYSLKNMIKPSYFETNQFLMKKKFTTLIEYASFFGSTQIFRYLYKNGVELKSSLWLYAIHSDNPEMIRLLEENNVHPPNNSYETCIKEAIKCHHNDIVNYIQSNFIVEDKKNIDFENYYNENIHSYCFHYFNFVFFPQDITNKINFFYACKYDYFEIVKYFLKTMSIDIKSKIILKLGMFK